MRRGPRPGRGLPVGAAPRVAPGRRRRPPSSPAPAGPTCSCRPASSVRGSARGHSVHEAVTVPPTTVPSPTAVGGHGSRVCRPPHLRGRSEAPGTRPARRRDTPQAVAASPEVVPHETDRPASRHRATAVPVYLWRTARPIARAPAPWRCSDGAGDRRDRAAVGEEVAETLRFLGRSARWRGSGSCTRVGTSESPWRPGWWNEPPAAAMS